MRGGAHVQEVIPIVPLLDGHQSLGGENCVNAADLSGEEESELEQVEGAKAIARRGTPEQGYIQMRGV